MNFLLIRILANMANSKISPAPEQPPEKDSKLTVIVIYQSAQTSREPSTDLSGALCSAQKK